MDVPHYDRARYPELVFRWLSALVLMASGIGKTFFGSTDATLFAISITQETLSPRLVDFGVTAISVVEGVVALGLILHTSTRIFYVLAAGIVTGSLVGLFVADNRDCGCFGDVLTLTPQEHRIVVAGLTVAVSLGWSLHRSSLGTRS